MMKGPSRSPSFAVMLVLFRLCHFGPGLLFLIGCGRIGFPASVVLERRQPAEVLGFSRTWAKPLASIIRVLERRAINSP